MKYENIKYEVRLSMIDDEPMNQAFDSIIELEAFLLGYFYGVNKK